MRKAPLMPIKTVEKPITIAINSEMKYCFLYLLTAQLRTSCAKKKKKKNGSRSRLKKEDRSSSRFKKKKCVVVSISYQQYCILRLVSIS